MIGSSAIPNFPISILCRACGFNNHQLKRQFLFGLIGGIHAPAQPAYRLLHRGCIHFPAHAQCSFTPYSRKAIPVGTYPAFFHLFFDRHREQAFDSVLFENGSDGLLQRGDIVVLSTLTRLGFRLYTRTICRFKAASNCCHCWSELRASNTILNRSSLHSCSRTACLLHFCSVCSRVAAHGFFKAELLEQRATFLEERSRAKRRRRVRLLIDATRRQNHHQGHKHWVSHRGERAPAGAVKSRH